MSKHRGRIVLKFKTMMGWPITFPYVVERKDLACGWDLCSIRAEAKSFATMREAAAWVDSLSDTGPRTFLADVMKLTFVRIAPKRAAR